MSRRVDRALATAREVVTGIVCECGHVESEHGGGEGDRYRPCASRRDYTAKRRISCSCTTFRPVKFRVERAS